MATQTMRVFRHGKAVPVTDEMLHTDDLARALSPEGIAGVQERVEKLGHPRFDLVLASPAVRTRATAGLIANVDEFEVTCLDALCYEGSVTAEGRRMDEIFKKLGHVPFGRYHEEAGNDLFVSHGERAWDEVTDAEVFSERYTLKADFSTLVVGHHPFIGGMGLAAARSKPQGGKLFNETYFHEAQGYTLVYEGGILTDVLLHVD